jgi:GNAT superfamily N-acetyltransferase
MSAIDPDHETYAQVEAFLAASGLALRAWADGDFEAMAALSEAEGWVTAGTRPGEARLAWQRAWPALVVYETGDLIAFLRAISDQVVTTYVGELLVAPRWRARGIGTALLDACQALAPRTRLDLLSMPDATRFYERAGFRRFAGFRRSAWL